MAKINGTEFRQAMLTLAVQSAGGSEEPHEVIARAQTYSRWVLPVRMTTSTLEEFQMVEIEIGPKDGKV